MLKLITVIRNSLLVLIVLACYVGVVNSVFAQQADNRRPDNDRNNNEPRPDRDRNNRPNNGGNPPAEGRTPNNRDINSDNADELLQALIVDLELQPIDTQALDLPSIQDELPQLGKQLFFAKNLGGEQSVACASCHHPMLGGADNLSLPVGVQPVDIIGNEAHGLLGQGRFNGDSANNNLPLVPRHSPTVFNIGLNTDALFWDSRIETRRNNTIITPNSTVNDQGRRLADRSLPAGTTLAAAQARLPVTSVEEMRGDFSPGADDQSLREQLLARFSGTNSEFLNNWPIAFEQAFGDQDITFDRIAHSLGEYERSMVFTNSPWQNYLQGDASALTQDQKVGAVLFFANRGDGGAGCANCHRGDTLAGNREQLVAYPQVGPGKGNESQTNTSQDHGRENISNNPEDKFHFRAPSLLNIAVTAPYGHTGAYQTLTEVVNHYNSPRQAIEQLFAAEDGQAFSRPDAPFCQLPQVQGLMLKNNLSCAEQFPDAYSNSIEVVSHLEAANDGEVEARFALRRSARLSQNEVSQVVAFMQALTDPCVESRECLSPWIIDQADEASFPDDQMLNSHNQAGESL
ncbi:cytochrome-c peroxidase [Paraglaciecola sp.]|uniref:cytochrome-c peroxidase n=1 Tax=Paraglaciecola sp. TaxID=1920173 RepID=UPI003EF29C7A